jgi:hypothetical protein
VIFSRHPCLPLIQPKVDMNPTRRERFDERLAAAFDLPAEEMNTAIRALTDETVADIMSPKRSTKPSRKKIPSLWHSIYYLRQGYHLDATKVGRRAHWQGGDPPHKDAVCPACGNRFHLLWDIDCTDPRFRSESSQVFGKLTRIPLYYCLHCPHPTIYRCTNATRLRVFTVKHLPSEGSPFSDYPDAFPRTRLSLTAIPDDIETLVLVCQCVGTDWLRRKQRSTLTNYFGSRYLNLRRSQFGGVPVLQQDNPQLTCPYEKCPTHEWESPILGHRHFTMKLLASIESDARFPMETHGAQIVFHICWACQTIYADYQID